LLKKDPTRGIKSAREEVDCDVADIFAKLIRIVGRGHSVVIRDEIITVAFALSVDRWLDGAKVVPDVKFPAWLKARQNSHQRELRFFGPKRKAKSYMRLSSLKDYGAVITLRACLSHVGKKRRFFS
jgi:hypothetical protein